MFTGNTILSRLCFQILAAGSILLGFSACNVTEPRHYPANKPFVYDYKIKVDAPFSNKEKNELLSALTNQLDDSIRVRTARKLFYHGFNTPVLDHPPVYESGNADKSVIFMRALLNAHGYFKDSITYDTTMRIIRDQQRVTVNFNVKPGKLVQLDSISYTINHPELQSLTQQHMRETFLKKNGAFARDTIAFELDRLVDLYRNNGFMRFSRDELVGLWDTLDVSLLAPSMDPFEDLGILQKLKERRTNPKANLEIRLRPGLDSTRLFKYYIGNITVYPDYRGDITSDSVAQLETHTTMEDGVKVVWYNKVFKPKIIPQNIYLQRDSLYRITDYQRTLDRFNSLGAWRLVTLEPKIRPGTDTVDFTINLTPAKKYSFNANLEGSNNNSVISGNLFGIAVNAGVQNRNFAKAANQSITNVRYGIETGKDSLTRVKFTQTRQLSLSHTIYFPHPIPNNNWIPARLRENFRSVFSFNAANTERRELYNLTTLNGSWGYEFQWKHQLISMKLLNIEYSSLNAKQKLLDLFQNNPSLRNIFTDGFISSFALGYTATGGDKHAVNVFRANTEESGLIAGMIKSKFLNDNLYKFVKLDAEFVRKVNYPKSSLVMRLFAGAGYEFNSTPNPSKKNNLPFFKQYFGGGPNSMRAWGLRKLGPGSVIRSFGSTGIPERYGDVQLEGNIEYRFPVTVISGVKINGALFTDMGNVWFLKKAAAPSNPEEVFSFGRLGKDLAVGVGAGMRVDFSFFVVRLDYAYKAKDPSPRPENAAAQNQWFYGWKPLKGQLQLGISYPFIL